MKCGRDRTSIARREDIIRTGGIIGKGFFFVFWHWFVTVDGFYGFRLEEYQKGSKSLRTNNIPVAELAVSKAA